MKLAALIPVAAAVALSAALCVSAAPVPHGLVQRNVTQLVDVKTQRRTLPDSLNAVPFLQRRDQQELVRRAGPNIFELGNKALDHVANPGRGGFPDGIPALDGKGLDLMSVLKSNTRSGKNFAKYVRLLTRMHVDPALRHVDPERVNNLLHGTGDMAYKALAGPVGTTYVRSGTDRWHWVITEDALSKLAAEDIQTTHKHFVKHLRNQAARDPGSAPSLEMHIHPGLQQTQAQAHQHPPTIEVPSSSSESSTLRPMRKRPSPIGAQAGPSTSYVNKGKGIMMEVLKSGNADYVPQTIHKRPWFDAFSDSTPRIGSSASPNNAPAFDKNLDTKRRPAKPEPDTELRLAPLTPAKASERPLLQPEPDTALRLAPAKANERPLL